MSQGEPTVSMTNCFPQGGFLFGGSAQALKTAELEALRTASQAESSSWTEPQESQDNNGNTEDKNMDLSAIAEVTEVDDAHMDNNGDVHETSKGDEQVVDEPNEGSNQPVVNEPDDGSSKMEASPDEPEQAADEPQIEEVNEAGDVNDTSLDKPDKGKSSADGVNAGVVEGSEEKEEPIVEEPISEKGESEETPETEKEEPVAEDGDKVDEQADENGEEVSEKGKDIEEPFKKVTVIPMEKKTPTRRGRRSELDVLKEATDEAGLEVGKDEPSGSVRRSSRRQAAQPTPKSTPKPKAQPKTPKSVKAVVVEQDENGDEEPKEPPKRRGRRSAAKAKEEKEEEEAVEEDEQEQEPEPVQKTPVGRGRKRAAPASEPKKAATKKEKQNANKTVASDDPFSFESQGNNHPQPLFSVTKSGFSNIKFTLSPRVNRSAVQSKYVNTEKAAAEKRNNSQSEEVEELSPAKPFSITELSTSTPSAKAALKTAGWSQRRGRAPKASPEPKKEKLTPAKPVRVRKQSVSPVLPKKSEPVVTAPQVAQERQPAVDLSHEPYPEGMRVFALWGRELYPAVVCDRDGLGRYKVFFVEDSLHRDIPPTGIVPLAWLKDGARVSVALEEDGDEVESTVAVRQAPDPDDAAQWCEAVFAVSTESGKSAKYPWNKLFLTVPQQKAIGIGKNTAVVVAEDNVVPRTRRSRASQAAAPAVPPSPSPKAGRKRRAEADETPPAAKPTPAKRGRRSKAQPEAEEEPQSEPADQPMEVDTGTLFKDKVYLLTSSARRANMSDFNKRHFKAMIEERGGVVAEEINEIPEGAEAYLIADTYYRTHKYLFALVADYPCVHFDWVRKCVDQNKILPYQDFLLPAGISMINEQEYQCRPLKGKLLKDKTVFVFSAAPSRDNAVPFADIWRPLLITLGAEVITTKSTSTPEVIAFIDANNFDYMLSDRSCEDAIKTHVERLGRSVASSNWVINNIITGELAPVSAHKSFLASF